jgi:hypothetical protein
MMAVSLADRTYRSGFTAGGPLEAWLAVGYLLSSLPSMRQTLRIWFFGRRGAQFLRPLGISARPNHLGNAKVLLAIFSFFTWKPVQVGLIASMNHGSPLAARCS